MDSAKNSPARQPAHAEHLLAGNASPGDAGGPASSGQGGPPPPKEEPSTDLPQNPFPGIPTPSAVVASTSPSSLRDAPSGASLRSSGQDPSSVSALPPSSEILTTSPGSRKPFPFMLVTFVLFVILAGFGASFLFFQGKIPGGLGGKKTAKTPIITSPVSPMVVSPTPTTSSNPFASPSAALLNPFASPSPTYANPFGQSQNPFSAVVTQAQTENQSYQNPFATPTP